MAEAARRQLPPFRRSVRVERPLHGRARLPDGKTAGLSADVIEGRTDGGKPQRHTVRADSIVGTRRRRPGRQRQERTIEAQDARRAMGGHDAAAAETLAPIGKRKGHAARRRPRRDGVGRRDAGGGKRGEPGKRHPPALPEHRHGLRAHRPFWPRRRRGDRKPLRREDDEAAHGGFGRKQEALDGETQGTRQRRGAGRRHLRPAGQRDQRGDEGREQRAVPLDDGVPVHSMLPAFDMAGRVARVVGLWIEREWRRANSAQVQGVGGRMLQRMSTVLGFR